MEIKPDFSLNVLRDQKMFEKEIDWTPLLKYSENTIECACGTIYRSHSKGMAYHESITIVTRKPCPSCGRDHDHVRACRSDVEEYSVKG